MPDIVDSPGGDEFKEDRVDCDDPAISKQLCKETVYCLWNKFTSECKTITASPTKRPTPQPSPPPTPPPTTARPTIASSDSPSASPTATPNSSPSSSPTNSADPSAAPSSSPTKSSQPTISTEPTDSPTRTHYPTLAGYEYVRPKRNDNRFVPWTKLDRNLQVIAQDHFRYSKDTWDNFGTNPIEYLQWDDLSDKQKEAAVELGFEDEVSWNCWMNNWQSFSWKQLHSLQLAKYMVSLGWDMDQWNSQYNNPPAERKGVWDEMTMEQQRNANQLCFYKTSYDRLDLPSHGFGYPMAKPEERFVPWQDIDEKFRVKLEQSLGYTELTWNVLRLADIEQMGWFEFAYDERVSLHFAMVLLEWSNRLTD